MKTSSIPLMLAALALAGCRGDTERADTGAAAPGAQPAQTGAPPQPAQGRQAPGQLAHALGKPEAPPPNVQAGEQIAAKGAPNGVTACVSCHGAQGEGMAPSGFPRLAGQSAYYLGKQLEAYAGGARVNAVMTPIAKAMSAEQIRDVSGYYATLGPQAPAAAKPTAAAARRGEQLSRVGDASAGVQACVNCHGPAGAGEPPIYPYLAGQVAAYLTASMNDWKGGARKTDPSGQMIHIAKALPDADVKSLSAYFSAQPPPPAAATRINIAAGSAQKPAVAAGPGAPGPQVPGAAAAGVTGAGTEAGAPVMGGSPGETQAPKPPPPPVKK